MEENADNVQYVQEWQEIDGVADRLFDIAK
jgi:hypothetical protein